MKRLLLAVILALSWPMQAFSCECFGPHNFNSIEDLAPYQFIAFVSIDSIYRSDDFKSHENHIFYQADLTILELFKGDSTSSIKVGGGNASLGGPVTSCDIEINQHEKWLIFAFKDENDNLITGYCTFSTMYASATGVMDWKHERGIKELKRLRDIFDHEIPSEKHPDGIHKSYYPNGNIELKQSYKNGIPHGQKTVYYPNGQIMIYERYENGKKEGKSIWYDHKGRIERDYQFSNGHPVDTCFTYWPYNGLVRQQGIFDDEGNVIKESNFDSEGRLKEVSIADHQKNQLIKTRYAESGEIESVSIRNAENHQPIKTTEFYLLGMKRREWKYFPNDSTKVFKYWEWSSDGDLYSNFILLKDGTKIDLIE